MFYKTGLGEYQSDKICQLEQMLIESLNLQIQIETVRKWIIFEKSFTGFSFPGRLRNKLVPW